MLSNHYKSNASSLTVVESPPANDSVQQLFDDLLTAVEQEGQSLYEAYNRLKGLATNFTSMYTDDVLKQLVDILANVFLSGMKTVGDATLNILCDLASTAFDALNTNIHIPVISDILNALGVPDLSMLDLFCWIPAVAYTVTYKIAHDSAPFSSTEADAIIGAESWDDLKALFGGSATAPSQESSSVPEGASCFSVPKPPTLSSESEKDVYIGCHAVGAMAHLLSGLVTALEADGPSDFKWNIFNKPMSTLNALPST